MSDKVGSVPDEVCSAKFDKPVMMARNDIDVLILGAGIHGASVFHDLCEQGLRCLLCDAVDYGDQAMVSGAHLLNHDRQQSQAQATRGAAANEAERTRRAWAAPHALRAVDVVQPVFSRGGGLTVRALAGLGFPSLAASVKAASAIRSARRPNRSTDSHHSILTAPEARLILPGISDEVTCAIKTRQLQVLRPERLVWELIQDGLALSPDSAALNHCRLTARQGGQLTFELANGRAVDVYPRIVVNASGPWLDHVNVDLGLPTRLIRHFRRTYAVLNHADLSAALGGKAVVYEARPGAMFALNPLQDRILVGPEEVETLGPNAVECEAEDVTALLARVEAVFPGLHITRAHVTYVDSGLYPVAVALKQGQSASPPPGDGGVAWADPSLERPFPLLSVAGGNWASHHRIANAVADLTLEYLDHPKRQQVDIAEIGGGRGYPDDVPGWVSRVADDSGLSEARVATLFARYGTTAQAIAAYEVTHPRAMICGDYSRAEISWIARNEHVRHLSDLVLRRTPLALSGAITAGDIAVLAVVAGAALGWDPDRCQQETSRLLERLKHRHMMPL